MPYLNQNRKPAGGLALDQAIKAAKPQARQPIKMPAPVKIPAPSQTKG
jgi:hypothetical protein